MKPSVRRGFAAAEFALILPVMILIIFGTIDVISMMRVEQRLNVVAFECARVAATPKTTMNNVKYQRDLLCHEGQISEVSLTVQPENLGSISSGDWLTVTASTDFATNSFIGGWLFPNLQLTKSMSIQKN